MSYIYNRRYESSSSSSSSSSCMHASNPQRAFPSQSSSPHHRMTIMAHPFPFLLTHKHTYLIILDQDLSIYFRCLLDGSIFTNNTFSSQSLFPLLNLLTVSALVIWMEWYRNIRHIITPLWSKCYVLCTAWRGPFVIMIIKAYYYLPFKTFNCLDSKSLFRLYTLCEVTGKGSIP